ncbi:MAG TPA: hypothetical protein VFB12_32910 [Ktedonobacteraceae bacterium]|nr:hypothetical protein [Ktedonobacteraceae bacterium]
MNETSQHVFNHKRYQHYAQLLRRLCILLLIPLIFSFTLLPGSVAHAATTGTGPGLGLATGQLWSAGKGKLTQTAAFLQAKNAHQVNPLGRRVSLAFPSSFSLAAPHAVAEPLAYGNDDAGSSYTDYYNWYLCGPGAATVALWYWSKAPWPAAGNYSDPHMTRYWNQTVGHQDVMYLAYGFTPPNSGWTSPGIMTYSSYSNYSNTYSAFSDMVIGLNYEASGQSSSWLDYFYAAVGYGNLSQAGLLSDVEADLYNAGVPLIVSVNDSYLPDWSNSGYKGGSHFVAIVGYNNSSGTYTYYETCDKNAAGCETTGYGEHTISQSQMYSATQNDNGNGGVIW